MHANGFLIPVALMGSAMLAGATSERPQPAAVSDAPGASMPSLLWDGVRKVSILCLVTLDPSLVKPDTLLLRRKAREMLCRHLVERAAAGAPYPVTEIAYADPAVYERDRMTLLLHARLEGKEKQLRLLFTIRPYRTGEEAGTLFGTAPELVRLGDLEAPDPALDAALATTLNRLLPWQSRSPAGGLPSLITNKENDK